MNNIAEQNNSSRYNIIGLALIAIALVVAASIIAGAYKYKFRKQETIRVTGSAGKDFSSDLIVWNGSYSRKAFDLKEAYSLIKIDEKNVKNYLVSKGVKPDEMIFSSVKIDKQFDTKYNEDGRITGSVFTGYNLMQNIKVESKEIAKVEELARESTGLIETGIELNSPEPLYFYTKLADLKLDLLDKAAEDARKRADIIANKTGGKIANVSKANMGIFQITGQNSDENYSYGGAFNTSSKNKTASITVNLECTVK